MSGGYPMEGSKHAHRVVYQRLIGTLPDDVQLHHRCHTPACVNPWHMEPLTARAHALLHGNGKYPRSDQCPAGHEYTEENTYVHARKDGRRERHCRRCHRERMRERSRGD
jgi:hypothetical protein